LKVKTWTLQSAFQIGQENRANNNKVIKNEIKTNCNANDDETSQNI